MKLLIVSLFFFPLGLMAFEVIAHRGLPRLYPEHSMQSLKEALKFHPDYVEPDLVLSKDDVPVVLHDIHIDTTTNVAKVFPKRKRKDGRYYAVDFNFAELKKLRLNHRIDLKTRESAFITRPLIEDSTLTIPSLEEFATSVVEFNKKENQNIGIYPEIKSPSFHTKEAKDIVKIVHDQLLEIQVLDPQLKIIVQCFDFKAIKRLSKDLKSDFFLVQLVAENSWKESDTDYDWIKSEEGLLEVRKYAKGIGPWIPQIINKDKKATDFLLTAKKLGFVVHPYTLRNDALPSSIESEEKLLKLLIKEIKVDGVFTDNVNTTVGLAKSIISPKK